MKLILLLFSLSFIIIPRESVAQPMASGNQSFEWDIVGSSLNEVQSYVWSYWLNTKLGGVFKVVICSGTASPFVCKTPIPPMTPGKYEMQIQATHSVGGEGPKSPTPPFIFTFVASPGGVTNIRIIQTPPFD